MVSSEGAPFEVWQLLRTWTEAQRAETLDAEKAIAFSENLRRQSRWGEIDHHLLDMLQRELQEKYFIVTGNEETLDAEKAIAFSENLRRQSRWGEIDHHLLDMLQRELQEKYFIVTGNEDDHFWDRAGGVKLTTIYLICCNGSYRRNILS